MDARWVSNGAGQGFFVGLGGGGGVGRGVGAVPGGTGPLGLAPGAVDGEPDARVLPTPAMHQLKRP